MTPNCEPTQGNREDAVCQYDNSVANKQRKERQKFRVTLRTYGVFLQLAFRKISAKSTHLQTQTWPNLRASCVSLQII